MLSFDGWPIIALYSVNTQKTRNPKQAASSAITYIQQH